MSEYKLYKPYAGLSNPDAPKEILTQMTQLATRLDGLGFTLRTAGGIGGDEAFEAGTQEVEVHIPWKGFNNRTSKFCRNDKGVNDVIRNFAPAFDTLKPAVQAIVASKAHAILGKDLRNPVRFLICWTADGCETLADRTARTGYIGVAIALASSLKIPVFNLKNSNALERIKQQIDL